jgi:predicted transcriptional regulator
MNNTQQINDLYNRIDALTEQIHTILAIKGNFAPELIQLLTERFGVEMQVDRLTQK